MKRIRKKETAKTSRNQKDENNWSVEEQREKMERKKEEEEKENKKRNCEGECQKKRRIAG